MRIEKEKKILGGDESSCRSRMRLTKQDFVIDKTDAAWERGSEVKESRFIKTRITNCWVSVKDEG